MKKARILLTFALITLITLASLTLNVFALDYNDPIGRGNVVAPKYSVMYINNTIAD